MNRLVFLWFFFPLVLEGQEQRFARIDAEQGKPIGKINAIDQDPHGFMWFLGTGERCLYKYDGWRITRYGQENQNINTLGGTDLSALHVDDSGIVWIGFAGSGLDRFDPLTETFTHYRNKINDSTSLSTDNLTAILRDRQGRLWVGTTRKIDQKISITISDNGTGIPPFIISKIFQPFFTAKPTGEGTGLGLSMAYDIITKAHGGELLVKSTEGVGTDFEIILPISFSQPQP